MALGCFCCKLFSYTKEPTVTHPNTSCGSGCRLDRRCGCYLALWASVSSPHSHRRRSWRGSLTKPMAGSLEMKGSAETGTQREVSHQRDIKVSQEEIVTPVLAAVVRRVRQRTHQLGPESKPRSQVHKAGTCPPHSLYMSRIVAVFSHDLMAPCTLKAFTTRLSGTAGG